jgi:hypothetical protein
MTSESIICIELFGFSRGNLNLQYLHKLGTPIDINNASPVANFNFNDSLSFQQLYIGKFEHMSTEPTWDVLPAFSVAIFRYYVKIFDYIFNIGH